MKHFLLKQSEGEIYTSHSEPALIGLCLNRYGQIEHALKTLPLRHGIAHGHIVKTYLGLLCLGKSDFEAAENHRRDVYFQTALDIGRTP